MNWIDALARRLGTAPAKPRRFRPSLETLDQRVVPALVAATSSICGFVYCDADNDGVKDAGEAGIAGVVINLTGTDAWGQPVSLTTTTGADGAYCFTQDNYGAAILPGTYTLTEVQPAGYADGKDTQGSPASGTVGNDTFTNVNLGDQTAGVNAVNYNFGEICAPPPPVKGSICGTVYVDCNKNGTQDAGEPGIPGVCVTLTGPSGTRTVSTDAKGDYCFKDLVAGSYKVTESQPAGYLQGTTKAGNLGGTVSGDVISAIPVNGNAGTEYNFGEVYKGQICGKVGYDKNCDGKIGYGDGGMCGVKVTLTCPDGSKKTTYTDKNGCYSFDNLPNGCYTISQSCPTGYRSGSQNCGTLGGYTSGGSVCGVNVGGSCGTGYDFCNKLAYGCYAPPTNSIGCWY